MSVFWEGVVGGLESIWVIARIVIPLMLVLEIARANRILDKVNHVICRPFRFIGLSEDGAFPVVVAMIFGLTFGSGVILNNIRQGKLTQREIHVGGTFMAVCHALVEDTLIFSVVGVPLWVLILPRTGAAFIVSFLVYRLWNYYLSARKTGSAVQ